MSTRLRAAAADLDDQQAVQAVLEGDREAYRILVRRYQDVLYRHALRMVGDGDDAADLVQQALVTGYRKLSTCREPERVGGWLFRILSNLCKDHLKSPRRSEVSLAEEGTTEPHHGETPEAHAARSELRRRLDRALDRLPPDQREAFALKHVEGLSYGEMARLLDAGESALKMRVLRAREAMREMLGDIFTEGS